MCHLFAGGIELQNSRQPLAAVSCTYMFNSIEAKNRKGTSQPNGQDIKQYHILRLQLQERPLSFNSETYHSLFDYGIQEIQWAQCCLL